MPGCWWWGCSGTSSTVGRDSRHGNSNCTRALHHTHIDTRCGLQGAVKGTAMAQQHKNGPISQRGRANCSSAVEKPLGCDWREAPWHSTVTRAHTTLAHPWLTSFGCAAAPQWLQSVYPYCKAQATLAPTWMVPRPRCPQARCVSTLWSDWAAWQCLAGTAVGSCAAAAGPGGLFPA